MSIWSAGVGRNYLILWYLYIYTQDPCLSPSRPALGSETQWLPVWSVFFSFALGASVLLANFFFTLTLFWLWAHEREKNSHQPLVPGIVKLLIISLEWLGQNSTESEMPEGQKLYCVISKLRVLWFQIRVLGAVVEWQKSIGQLVRLSVYSIIWSNPCPLPDPKKVRNHILSHNRSLFTPKRDCHTRLRLAKSYRMLWIDLF